MWFVAGILLGVVVLGAVLGFHTGPHTHAAAGVAGLAAAAWLLVMAFAGRSALVLWVIFSADLAISAGVGVMAVVGISTRRRAAGHRVGRLEGADGVALSELSPDGIVRVNGEDWSAVSLNGTVPAGTRVQVIRAGGVRLEVWGEEVAEEHGRGRRLDRPTSEGKST